MAARAIASGTISFGLVSVPVKLFTGTQSKSVSFNLLHGKDKSRLKQQYICSTCGEVVERDDMVRGYEYAKDQYAVLIAGGDQGARADRATSRSRSRSSFRSTASTRSTSRRPTCSVPTRAARRPTGCCARR